MVKESISRIIAQTCKRPGLSNVLIELFNYSDNELYFEKFRELAGKSFGETINLFEKAVVLGYKRKNEIFLNPIKHAILKENDELLILAEDDGISTPNRVLPILDNVENLISTTINKNDKINVLVLGINDKLPTILQEMDNYLEKNSKVYCKL